MTIAREQNSEHNINLLKAFSQLYSEAKRLHLWHLAGMVAAVMVSRFVDSRVAGSILGSLSVAFSWIVQSVEAGKAKLGAIVQEEFDVGLFRLPWNKLLVGRNAAPELIHSAARRFKGDVEHLRNWYDDPGDPPYPLDVLACQRANVVWDMRLRKNYVRDVTVISVVVILLGIVFRSRQTVADYLVIGLFPAAPLLRELFDTIRKNQSLVVERQRLSEHISDLFDEHRGNGTMPSVEECRHIQDHIFMLRRQDVMVPDLWQRIYRPRFQRDFRDTMREFRNRTGTA